MPEKKPKPEETVPEAKTMPKKVCLDPGKSNCLSNFIKYRRLQDQD